MGYEEFQQNLYKWMIGLKRIKEEMLEYRSYFNDHFTATDFSPYHLEAICETLDEGINTEIVVQKEVKRYQDKLAELEARITKLEQERC